MFPLAMRNSSLCVPEAGQGALEAAFRMDNKLQSVMARYYQQYMVACALINPATHEINEATNHENELLVTDGGGPNTWWQDTRKDLGEFQRVWNSWMSTKQELATVPFQSSPNNWFRTPEASSFVTSLTDSSIEEGGAANELGAFVHPQRCPKLTLNSFNHKKGSAETAHTYTPPNTDIRREAHLQQTSGMSALFQHNKTLNSSQWSEASAYSEKVASAFSSVPQLSQLLRYFTHPPTLPQSSHPPSEWSGHDVAHCCPSHVPNGTLQKVPQQRKTESRTQNMHSKRLPVQRHMTQRIAHNTDHGKVSNPKDESTKGQMKTDHEVRKINTFLIPNLLDTDPPADSKESSAVTKTSNRISTPERFHCRLCDRSYSTQTGLVRHQTHKHNSAMCNAPSVNDGIASSDKRFRPHSTSKLPRLLALQKAKTRAIQPLELRIGKLRHHAPHIVTSGCARNDSECGVIQVQAKQTETLISRPFCCHVCTKIYYSMSALKMHVRTHTLPCKCGLCGKAFSRMWLLNGHLRTHTGEKPFACSVCTRAFADRSNLRAHMQTHSEVKRYHCPRCTKTFSRMGLLTKHQAIPCGSIISGDELKNRTYALGSSASLEDTSETTRESTTSNDHTN